MSSEEEQQQNIERMASAIEDLLYMGAIKFGDADQESEKAILSNQFSIIVSNVMSNMKNFKEDDDNEVMKLMYYSLLIYLNEHLKLPKSLTMALGNDLEKRREEMQSGELISNYVAVLHSIFSKQRKDMKKM
ncbi:MAG TPA: hypothetical protein VE244_15415 [Nitrososphaeraceae archaeon]|jgi:hypothetical protein|nr:hypothetical protein [Nitrososphaeraceae archaeon]